MVSCLTQTKIICKSYAHWKLAHQLANMRFTKLLKFTIKGWCLEYIVYLGMAYDLFTIGILGETFSIVLWVTQTKIVCKRYTLQKLTYQLRTLGFIKILSFHILGSCLGYTISNDMVYGLLNIDLLWDTFSIVSRETQMEIIIKIYVPKRLKYQVTTLGFTKLSTFHLLGQYFLIFILCESYNPTKFTYELTTLGFTKLLSFHLLGKCLGYSITKEIMYSLFNILVLGDWFSMVSQATQTNIICKSYAPKKLLYKLTSLVFKTMLLFNILG